MRVFHIATVADWQAARAGGRYTTSTRGRTLAEEGFIHASRGDQWQGVRERYYADVTEPLVLLVIDTALLTAPVVEEHVPGSDETFPHVYGAIEPAAVVQVLPLEPAGEPAPQRSFASLFLSEVGFRSGLGIVVLVVAVLLGLLAGRLWGAVTSLVVILVALGLGLVAGGVVLRRRDRRYHQQHPRPKR